MPETIYYQDPDVKITSAFVHGKGQIYPIDGIVGIETKRPTIKIALGIILWLAFGFGTFVPSGNSAGAQGVVIAFFVVYSLGLLGWLFMCPVFVRTASGLTQIGVPKFPAARHAIMQAFADAKSATAVTPGVA